MSAHNDCATAQFHFREIRSKYVKRLTLLPNKIWFSTEKAEFLFEWKKIQDLGLEESTFIAEHLWRFGE